MSKCMTIADEAIDQKDILLEIEPKEIVEIILEEALLSALLISDKDCSRIGDSNITDEFRQYGQLSNLKDFEQVETSQAQPAGNKDSNLNFRENSDRVAVPAKGNLEQIIDSFVKEEKVKPLNNCQVISEELLAQNELQITNGQIHIENNNAGKDALDSARQRYYDKKEVIKDEKIEIEYFNEGQLNKIYVPLNATKSAKVGPDCERKEEDASINEEKNSFNEENAEDTERPFEPFTTEELRQSSLKDWQSSNSSLVDSWNGNLLQQDTDKIIEKLSFVQAFPRAFSDPSRPRAYAFDEEDVKKMTREIEDINFPQSPSNSGNLASGYLNSRNDANVEANIENSENEDLSSLNYKSNNQEEDQTQDVLSSEKEIRSQSYVIWPHLKEENYLNDSLSEMEHSIKEQESRMKPNYEFNIQMQSNTEENSTREPSNILSENTESLSGIQENESFLEEPDLIPDLDENLTQKESSSVIEDRNESDSQNIPSDLNYQRQQNTLSWNGLKWTSQEADCIQKSNLFFEEKHWERISVECDSLTNEAEEKRENDAENFLQGSQSQLGRHNSNSEMIQNDEDAIINTEKPDEGYNKRIYPEKKVENVEKSDEIIYRDEIELIKEESEAEPSMDGATSDFIQTNLSAQNSNKTLVISYGFNNEESNQILLQTSQFTRGQDSDQSTLESTQEENSETILGSSQKFKLHSQKICIDVGSETAGPTSNDFNLTESEETFIDISENIIQVIEPQENSTDEDSNEISFSLLSGTSNTQFESPKDTKSEAFLKKRDPSESEILAKKVYSGMTTIGPIKNPDYNGQDLTAPEVDYGKMTLITSSRQLARDMGLLNSENPNVPVKIIEEDDSDDDTLLNINDEQETVNNSLVNRDIASLTKVQKIREVMSHQAKPEEDFEDEESLPRPRLDLKDVESMSDERYKFPDLSIPFIPFEIGDRNFEAEKEIIETMGLVLSGLTNACFYDEEENSEFQSDNPLCENENNAIELPNNSAIDKKNSKTEYPEVKEMPPTNSENETFPAESTEKEVSVTKESQHENFRNLKSSTLGNVFKRASCKFMQKDSETSVRNSKSLPRDTSKISASNSIRSFLDDCQSSATNMLRKSCSLLKNTENIFKSISQSMVTSDRSSGSNTTQKKLSPSESDMSTIERKFSGYFKKEELTKAKNLIKSKVEKTLKISDKEKSPTPEFDISEKNDLRVAVKNEENLRIDRIENFKKLLPKSPLVYKSQFVRSQMNFQSVPEPEPALSPPTAEKQTDETVDVFPVEENNDTVPVKENELLDEAQALEASHRENLKWIIQKQELQLPVIENDEMQQPDFIVMETIQGLPASDMESPSSEKENLNVENSTKKGKTFRSFTSFRMKGPKQQDSFSAENDLKNIEASHSLQILTGSSRDIASRFPGADEEKTVKTTPSEKKIKNKKKKFTARFRSFWSSTFRRVKTPEKKSDLS